MDRSFDRIFMSEDGIVFNGQQSPPTCAPFHSQET